MNLRTYIKKLESHGELKRVRVEVDPVYEMGEIAQRAMRQGGPALLFENVKGSPYRALMNMNGTRRRLHLALGEEPGLLGYRLASLIKDMQPPSLRALWTNRQAISRALSMRVKHVRSGPVHQVVQETADLTQLPILKCWPLDAGRFITLPLVQTVSPQTGKTNLGMYRMQVYGPAETGMHWQIVRGAEEHASRALSNRLPCVVSLGGDPALTLATIFPLPQDMEELPFAGLLRGKAQPLVHAKTQPLWVPADVEFSLEGYVDLSDKRVEGPFGDHFGHYSHAAPYPTFKLTALTHRKDPIYTATIVGKPPQEDKVWGEAINEFSAPILKLIHPEIEDFWTYFETGFHNLLVVSVRQRHAKEGVKTALGLLGQGQLSLCKVVVLVDPGVDTRDFRAVLKQALIHFDPREDMLLLPGTPLDTLDFSSYTMNLGSKLILDFTSAHGGIPGPRQDSLKLVRKTKAPAKPKPFNPGLLKKALGKAYLSHASWEDCLLVVRVETQGKGAARELAQVLKTVPLGAHKLLALVSDDVDISDSVSLVWGLFTRFDAARDMQFTSSSLRQAWPLHQGVLGLDATWKKGYPDPVEMPKEIVRRVDKRWKEYGLS